MDAVADGGCESRKHPPGLACAAHFQHTTAQRSVYLFDYIGVPKGIRTPVTAVKGRCPGPLDDGDANGIPPERNGRWVRADAPPGGARKITRLASGGQRMRRQARRNSRPRTSPSAFA